MQDNFKQIEITRTEYVDVVGEDGKVIDTRAVQSTREYAIVFNVNVIDQIDAKYKKDGKNGFFVLTEKLESNDIRSVWNTVADFLCMCINEGIRMENIHRKDVGLKLLSSFKAEEIDMGYVEALDTTLDVIGNGMPESKN